MRAGAPSRCQKSFDFHESRSRDSVFDLTPLAQAGRNLLLRGAPHKRDFRCDRDSKPCLVKGLEADISEL